MTIQDAAERLRNMYGTAPENQKVVQIHLFGIRYADQLDGMPLHELAERAGIPRSYGTEIRKGMNLARFVELK